MALLRDVIYKSGPKITKFLKLERDLITLKPVKKLTIRFDPFRDDVTEIRTFSNLIHTKETLQTNLRCVIKTEILTDRSDPTLTFDLVNGDSLILKCENLKCLEIFKLMNEYITPLAPKEEPVLMGKELKKNIKK